MSQTALPPDEATGAEEANPFVGPHALSEHDELFGRTLEVRMLRDLVIAERIVLLYSPSGAGKTSLLHAGLKQELIDDGFAVLPTVRIMHDAPDALAAVPIRNRYSLSTMLSLEAGRDRELDPATLAEITLDQYLELTRESRAALGQDCLFFDQFEELFTADPIDVDAKRDFLAELGEALRNRSRWAIISMREDFAAHLDPYLKLFPTRLRATFRLDLLGPQAAKAAIQGPMTASGVTFDDTVATALVDDLRTIRVQRDGEAVDQQGLTIEPVQLQVVCRRLWSLLNGAREITTEHMSELGNVDDALRDFYDDVITEVVGVTGVRERVLRAWISDELVTEQGYRAQVQHGPPDDGAATVLPALENAHLVRADRRRGTVWYELAHDRLVDPIRASNEEWLAHHLSDLQRGARAWEEQRRSDRALFVGDELRAVEEWATVHPDEVSDREAEFLAACRDEQQRIEKDARTRRRTRILAIAMSIVATVAVVALVASLLAWLEVEDQRDRAQAMEASSEYFFAAQSRELDYDVGPRLLLDAMALEALADALAEDDAPSTSILRGINTDRFEAYLTQNDEVALVTSGATTMSGDGSTVAVMTADGVRVTDLDGRRPDRLIPVEMGDDSLSSGEALALSADGSLLAFVPADARSIQLWNVSDGTVRELTPATPLEPYAGATLAFVDGDELLVAIDYSTAAVFDVAGASEVTPAGFTDVPWAMWLTAQSGALVVVDTGGQLHVGHAATGLQPAPFDLEGDVIAVDRAGAYALVTDYETMTIHDLATGEVAGSDAIPFAPIVDFGDDGTVVTIENCDATVWARDDDEPIAVTPVPGCRDSLYLATLSDDGQRVLLEGYDTAPWWAVASLDEPAVLETSAQPDGMVAAGGDVIARVEHDHVAIDSVDDEGRTATREVAGSFQQVAVDPGGHAVVAATDAQLALIDPATGRVTARADLPWTPELLAIGGRGAAVAASSGAEVVRWLPQEGDQVASLDTADAEGLAGMVTALAVTGRSGAVVVGTNGRLAVHTETGSTGLAEFDAVAHVATTDASDAVVAVEVASGPTLEPNLIAATLHVWPDGRLASRSGTLVMARVPDAVALSGRHAMVATGVTSDVYDLRAVVSNAIRSSSQAELVGGHNDLSSYYGVPGLTVDEVAIDESGATPRFLWVPSSGPPFEVLLDADELLADIRRTAEEHGFEPLTDEECVDTAGIPCR